MKALRFYAKGDIRLDDVPSPKCEADDVLIKVACTKSGGTIFNVAIHDSVKTLQLNLLTLPEKRLMAGNAYTAEDFEKVMQVLSSRGTDIEPFITSIVPLERVVDDAFEELVRNKASHNKILVEVHGEGRLQSRL